MFDFFYQPEFFWLKHRWQRSTYWPHFGVPVLVFDRTRCIPDFSQKNHSFADDGPTVQDTNKTHKIDPPPKLGSLYPINPIFLIELDAYTILVKTSAGSEPNFAQAMLRPHMVLVYTISNKIHAILPIKIDFGPFWGRFLQFLKKIHATSQYYVPVLKSYPTYGGSVLWHLFISRTVGPQSPFWAIWGVFLQFLEKNSRNLRILCARFEELPKLWVVCFMTFIHISNRWATITILGHFGGVATSVSSFSKKIRNFFWHQKIEKNILYQIAIMTFIHISNRLASDHLGPNWSSRLPLYPHQHSMSLLRNWAK